MKKYKGYTYFLDKDGLWKVRLDKDHFFVVALDDSKLIGNKKIFWDKNTEETCKEYIDYITKDSC